MRRTYSKPAMTVLTTNLLINVSLVFDDFLTNQMMPNAAVIVTAKITASKMMQKIFEKLFSIKGKKKSVFLLLLCILIQRVLI